MGWIHKKSLINLCTGAQFGVEQKFLSLYSSLTEEERFQIGHSVRDLVKSCTFRGFDCMGMDEDTFDHEVRFTKSKGRP